MAFKRRGNRVKPLLDIHCQWITGNPDPDIVDIAMRNGRVVRYVNVAKAVRIHTGKDGWEKTGVQVEGYKKPPEPLTRRKRRV